MAQEEEARNQLFQNKKKLEQEASGLKKDIEDLELALQKVFPPNDTLISVNADAKLDYDYCRLSKTRPPRTTRSAT